MGEAALERMTYAEYRALEAATGQKHELVDGHAVGVTGGSHSHAVVIGNAYFVLRQGLAGRPCRVLGSEARLRIPLTRNARYPDAQVICGPVRFDEEDADAVTNPLLLVEVLSEGTAGVDRGEKFREYRTLDSLRHYLLIDPERRTVELFTRAQAGSWLWTDHAPGGELPLGALDLTLAVDALFEGL